MKKGIQIKISPCHRSGCWALVSHWEASSSVSGLHMWLMVNEVIAGAIFLLQIFPDNLHSANPSYFYIMTPLRYPWRGLHIILSSDSCLGLHLRPDTWLVAVWGSSVRLQLTISSIVLQIALGTTEITNMNTLKQRKKIVSQRGFGITFRVKYKVQRLMGQKRY
jgi:hypothetical protein